MSESLSDEYGTSTDGQANGRYNDRKKAFLAWLEYATSLAEKGQLPDECCNQLQKTYEDLERSVGDLAHPRGKALSFAMPKRDGQQNTLHYCLFVAIDLLSRSGAEPSSLLPYRHLHSIACEISTRDFYSQRPGNASFGPGTRAPRPPR